MRKFKYMLGAVSVLLLASTALAQTSQVNVGRVIDQTPKPGMAKQYEEGRKRHMDWHRKAGDTWTWDIWQVTTGERAGTYLSITFGHTWKDFDAWDEKYAEADTADATANMSPSIGRQVESYWMLLTDASRMTASAQPSKMAEVIHFMVKPGSEEDFDYGIRKATEAANQQNWAGHYAWYSLANGGESGHYVLVIPINSWADMAEPDPGFFGMLEKALGRHGAELLGHLFDKSIKGTWSEMITYRPDLSYRPTK